MCAGVASVVLPSRLLQISKEESSNQCVEIGMLARALQCHSQISSSSSSAAAAAAAAAAAIIPIFYCDTATLDCESEISNAALDLIEHTEVRQQTII